MYEPTEEDQRLETFELQHTLCLLASEADEQTDYLAREGYGWNIDELTLEFERHYTPGYEHYFHQLLTGEQLAQLRRISDKVESMYTKPEYAWDISDLHSTDWGELRELAKGALKTFGFSWGLDIRERLSATWPAGWERRW